MACDVDALRATMPQGRLDAVGNVAWSPTVKWQADATLAGFDPGYFAPDWPGAVNGTLTSSGELREGSQGLLAHVDAGKLGGQLRKRALSGRATVDIDGDAYRGDVAIGLGNSRIDAKGSIASTMQVEANLAPLHLDDLLPDGKGVLRGTLKLRGARNAPDIDIDLDGSGIAFGDYRAESISAKGRLPWNKGSGTLAIDARGVDAGLPLTGLQANLRGAVERLQFDADAQGDIGTLACRAMRTSRARAGRARWHRCDSRRNSARAGPCSNPRAGRGMAATARCRRPACAPPMAATCARMQTGRAAAWTCRATSCRWRWRCRTCRNAATVALGPSTATLTSLRNFVPSATPGAAPRR
jgi:autotransporter translocation and assembly factor TamB